MQVNMGSFQVGLGPNNEQLSLEELEQVEEAWRDDADMDEVVCLIYIYITKFQLQVAESEIIKINRSDIRCLIDGEWLNDEVMNFKFEQLNNSLANDRVSRGKNLKIWVWNTHFYVKLVREIDL